MTDSECKHPLKHLFYYPAVNEDGWRCNECDKKLGFRPDLDRKLTVEKVRGLLHDLHNEDLVYVSNGTMGEVIAENVASECDREGKYDEHFIIRQILKDPNIKGHEEYWKKKAKEKLNGDSS